MYELAHPVEGRFEVDCEMHEYQGRIHGTDSHFKPASAHPTLSTMFNQTRSPSKEHDRANQRSSHGFRGDPFSFRSRNRSNSIIPRNFHVPSLKEKKKRRRKIDRHDSFLKNLERRFIDISRT